MAKTAGEKVTRIKATSDTPKTPSKPAKTAVKKTEKPVKATKVRKSSTNPFLKALFGIGGYFKGAWTELRLVRWPTRRATWGLTFAVILFSAFFVVVILLLDILFKFIFEIILK